MTSADNGDAPTSFPFKRLDVGIRRRIMDASWVHARASGAQLLVNKEFHECLSPFFWRVILLTPVRNLAFFLLVILPQYGRLVRRIGLVFRSGWEELSSSEPNLATAALAVDDVGLPPVDRSTLFRLYQDLEEVFDPCEIAGMNVLYRVACRAVEDATFLEAFTTNWLPTENGEEGVEAYLPERLRRLIVMGFVLSGRILRVLEQLPLLEEVAVDGMVHRPSGTKEEGEKGDNHSEMEPYWTQEQLPPMPRLASLVMGHVWRSGACPFQPVMLVAPPGWPNALVRLELIVRACDVVRALTIVSAARHTVEELVLKDAQQHWRRARSRGELEDVQAVAGNLRELEAMKMSEEKERRERNKEEPDGQESECDYPQLEHLVVCSSSANPVLKHIGWRQNSLTCLSMILCHPTDGHSKLLAAQVARFIKANRTTVQLVQIWVPRPRDNWMGLHQRLLDSCDGIGVSILLMEDEGWDDDQEPDGGGGDASTKPSDDDAWDDKGAEEEEVKPEEE